MNIHRSIFLLIGVSWIALASPVVADCDPAGRPADVLPDAEVAFVGDVVEVRGSVAQISVREVWAGNVGAVVEVHGLGDEGRGPSEDDRRWERGTTYLVLPASNGAVLRDHICTATSEWTDELAALRPANARLLMDPAVDAAPPFLVSPWHSSVSA